MLKDEAIKRSNDMKDVNFGYKNTRNMKLLNMEISKRNHSDIICIVDY